MQAIVYHRYGTPDVLEFTEIAVPEPGPGEVLVRIQAASVNPYDWHFMRGTPRFVRVFTGFGKPRWPRLGADAAGIVEAVGAGVGTFKAGDAVFGLCRGSFAEYACGKADNLALMPASVTFQQAASVPIAGVTALQGLRDSGRLKPEDKVLLNGAAGGVGTFAVQIAKILGARVTGVCSAPKAETVRAIGADDVIDYEKEDFTQAGRQWDVIFDLVGNHRLGDVRRALAHRGTYVGCGGGGPDRSSGELLRGMLGSAAAAPFVSQRLTSVLAKINTKDLALLGEWMEAGRLKPVLDRAYSLPEAPAAVRYVEGCHARGKVTVTVH
jgi:NADPH:quinone reductase-like Zn-dependent oxidoreductase